MDQRDRAECTKHGETCRQAWKRNPWVKEVEVVVWECGDALADDCPFGDDLVWHGTEGWQFFTGHIFGQQVWYCKKHGFVRIYVSTEHEVKESEGAPSGSGFDNGI